MPTYRFSFQHPALFGQEAHHMTFNGKVDGTGQIGSISMSDGQHKVFHDSKIAAGMTFISRQRRYIFIPNQFLICQKIGYGKFFISPSIQPFVPITRVRRPPVAVKASIEKAPVILLSNSSDATKWSH